MARQSWRKRLPSYSLEALRGDLGAGLTTAVMLIPQAMAYALLAGLPPIVGLYAAAVPLLAYAVAGSSPTLAVGPVAMDSLLTAATVGLLAESGSEHYVELAALLALMVGVMQIALGAVRGGFLVNFLSRPVISGFTSAAAVIIAASQLRTLLGLDLPRSSSVSEIIISAGQRIGDSHLPTAIVAGASLVALWALKRYAPRWPRALIVVAAGTVAASLGGLAERGLAVVGEVPAGLPALSIPSLDVSAMVEMWPGALTIAFIAFLEAISVSTKLAQERGPGGRPVRANREFVALGLANSAAGLFGGYPVAGGLSRTAVNADAGARTKVSGLITAAGVAVTLALFTDLLYNIPKASLGAIIVMAVVGLIDARAPVRLWRVRRSDLAMLVATFVATLTLGIQHGIAIGVGLSLAVMVARTTRPHTAVLGRLPGTEYYRNIDRFPDAITEPGVLIVRLDAQFYFGNVNFLKQTLANLEAEMSEPLRAVIIDASGINQIDTSAEAALRELSDDYRARGVRLIMACVKGPVRDVLQRSGATDAIGPESFALCIHSAVAKLKQG